MEVTSDGVTSVSNSASNSDVDMISNGDNKRSRSNSMNGNGGYMNSMNT